jgi:hypothetical protein
MQRRPGTYEPRQPGRWKIVPGIRANACHACRTHLGYLLLLGLQHLLQVAPNDIRGKRGLIHAALGNVGPLKMLPGPPEVELEI